MIDTPIGPDPGPIEEQYREDMTRIGHLLDETLNGKQRPRKHGFVLLMFEFGPDKRFNYISNGERADIVSAMKEFIAYAEGAIAAPGGTA